jgi:glucose/arabinose dehydrogenase
MKRRQFLRLGAMAGTASLAGCTLETSSESERSDGVEIALESAVEGTTFPTDMSFLPNGDSLIIERTGQILLASDGQVRQTVLDLTDQMAEVAGERGLVGMALHPDFADNGKLYVRYSGQLTGEYSEEEWSHIAVLSELQMTADRSGIDPDSERRILEVPEPGIVHNAGGLAFSPEGYLYVALGDGQRTDLGDTSWSWWHEQGGAAQNTTDNLLGGILRIDVDNPADGREYGIPSDNPLVGEAGRDEYYAWGLRNPYKISVDDGRLFIGDVGEQTRESVYLSEKGANHGWPIVEGSSCGPSTAVGHTISDNPANVFNPKVWQSVTNRVSPRKVCPTPKETDRSFVHPIIEYRRSGARSVTGGYVYRGDAIPELQGSYIFGDFVPPCPIFATEPAEDGDKPWPMTALVVPDSENGRPDGSIPPFARDQDGEVYVLTTGRGEGSGKIRKIVPTA